MGGHNPWPRRTRRASQPLFRTAMIDSRLASLDASAEAGNKLREALEELKVAYERIEELEGLASRPSSLRAELKRKRGATARR